MERQAQTELERLRSELLEAQLKEKAAWEVFKKADDVAALLRSEWSNKATAARQIELAIQVEETVAERMAVSA